MSKKIFRACLLSAFVALLTSLVVVMTSLYGYFSEQQSIQLSQELHMATQGVELGGRAYLEGLEKEEYRLTWVDGTGRVLYDTGASGWCQMSKQTGQSLRALMRPSFPMNSLPLSMSDSCGIPACPPGGRNPICCPVSCSAAAVGGE